MRGGALVQPPVATAVALLGVARELAVRGRVTVDYALSLVRVTGEHAIKWRPPARQRRGGHQHRDDDQQGGHHPER